MDFPAALRAHLLAAPDVAALAGTRIAWVEQPQGAQRPSVTLNVISDPRDRLLKGSANKRRARIQADCRADTHMIAHQLVEAVLAAVDDRWTVDGSTIEPGEHEGPRDLGDENAAGQFIHRASVDLILWHF